MARLDKKADSKVDKAPDVAKSGACFLGEIMFSLYKLRAELTGAWDRVAVADTWEDMCRFVEDLFVGQKITVLDFTDMVADFLPVPKDFEMVFKVDKTFYVVYHLRDSRELQFFGYADYEYSQRRKYDYDEDYPDDDEVDYWGRREYLAQRREAGLLAAELVRMEEIFLSPELLILHYFPKGKPIDRVDKKNIWYVGALDAQDRHC